MDVEPKPPSGRVDRAGPLATPFAASNKLGSTRPALRSNVLAAGFCLILVGFVFLAILWVLNAIRVIIASIQASDGKFYRYPITIRFIQ